MADERAAEARDGSNSAGSVGSARALRNSGSASTHQSSAGDGPWCVAGSNAGTFYLMGLQAFLEADDNDVAALTSIAAVGSSSAVASECAGCEGVDPRDAQPPDMGCEHGPDRSSSLTLALAKCDGKSCAAGGCGEQATYKAAGQESVLSAGLSEPRHATAGSILEAARPCRSSSLPAPATPSASGACGHSPPCVSQESQPAIEAQYRPERGYQTHVQPFLQGRNELAIGGAASPRAAIVGKCRVCMDKEHTDGAALSGAWAEVGALSSQSSCSTQASARRGESAADAIGGAMPPSPGASSHAGETAPLGVSSMRL